MLYFTLSIKRAAGFLLATACVGALFCLGSGGLALGRIGRQDGSGWDRETRHSSSPNSGTHTGLTRESGEAALPPGHTLSEIESLELDCVDAVNRQRIAGGLNALASDEELLVVARAYSRRMAEKDFFSHVDPEGNDVRGRVKEAGIKWRMLGENLARNNGYINPVAECLSRWMASPGHRRNILEPEYTYTAVGVWISRDDTIYFTEIFMGNYQ